MVENSTLSIDVITRTRDRHDKLLACARSLRDQSLPPVRWIVVDDGSEIPVEAERLRQASGLDVTCIRNAAPKGRAGAAQTGFDAATSRAVLFLDDDDALTERGLEVLATALAPDIVAVAGACLLVKEPAERVSPEGLDIVDIAALARRNSLMTAATLFRRDVAVKVGGFDTSLSASEDWDLWMRLALEGEIAIVDHVCAKICADAHDVSRTTSDDHRRGLLRLRNKWLRADVAAGRAALSDYLPNEDTQALAEAQALARHFRRIAFWKR